MITKMKKLTFLVYHKEYEPFLERLRELGVVHVVERQRGRMDDTLQQFMQKRATYKNVLLAMYLLAGKQPDAVQAQGVAGDALLARYEKMQADIQALEQRLPALDKDLAQFDVWGDFSWQDIARLRDAGWFIQFYACAEKDFDASWEDTYNVVRICEQGGTLYFVTITPSPVELPIGALRLPASSRPQLLQEKAATEKALEEAREALRAFCKASYRAFESCCNHLQGDIDLWKVKLNSERMADGAVVLLEGWIPADKEAETRRMLDASGVYYEIRDARKGEEAPVKLRNNAFTRMYEVLTKMYGMPDYNEFDPTPILAPFFTLFFAFCMGDAGYGLVLVALGFLLKKKLPKSLAGMMNLVITLGIATTLLGTILGTCFGVSLFDVDVPQWLKQFMVVGKIGDTSYDKQMLLALLIGVVHICLAMTVKAIGETVRYGFKESLSQWGWLLLVVGFICTGGLSFFQLISEQVSTWAFIVIGGVSAIGIYLLNNLHRNVFINIGAGLWDTYNMATGLMGDLLSYIRLYALGLAGGMLGGVFNQLAFMVQNAAGGVPGWVFCGLILVFGHALNIAMSCLSAFVHPLRLTFVEYFKNSGYDGKGEAYKPFARVKDNQ